MGPLQTLISRHCVEDATNTALPRLTLARSDRRTSLVRVLAQPQFCVIAAGRKRVFLGAEPFYYDPTTYLIASAQLPVAGQVVEAPYLGLSLSIDVGVMAELLLRMPAPRVEQAPGKALAVTPLEPKLHDAVIRLLSLLDTPSDIPVLGPLVEREVLYHLLRGPHGGMLRQLAAPKSPLSQIRRAITWLQEYFDRPLSVSQLARHAGMSAPSFYRHFRAVTNMSPLQFQKRIRLQEARRRLLVENLGAADVAFDVGYESPSQFSREYRRLFGVPPAADATRTRKALSVDGSDTSVLR